MPTLRYPTQESLYFHNNIVSIIEHSSGYVRLDWHPSLVGTSELREACEQVLALLKEAGITNVISDNRLLAALMPDDQRWILSSFIPHALHEIGGLRCAIIHAHDVISRLAILKATKLMAPMVVSYFDNQKSAESWLLQAEQ